MRGFLLFWAVLVFALALLLGSPAAFWLARVDWPEGWEPQAVSGSLWRGRMGSIGQFGPVTWEVSLWRPGIDALAGFQQRGWAASVRGWPWAWQASLQEQGPLNGQPPLILVDGEWQGRLDVEGQWRRCESSTGQLQVPELRLVSPWVMLLGQGRVRLDCSEGARMLASLAREGEHHFEAEADLLARRTHLSGRIEGGAELAVLLRQFGLLGPGQQRFETTANW
ncbi:hypothetical protein [Stutzerimonas stutzeri]|uniref:General secretion pathway protein N n=1 Tax=Stutzerimonas stutzeri KOS6 TaxID=1218352 RepID=A0A061JWE6_STUST|nr:hypothetical protein [Stutzerimonas stutzeri]EWC43373.1 hypothetical protein B597_001385 [Stutzerimonas stutzeri KOS6]